VFLSGINHPWYGYGHDFGGDRGLSHACHMRQVLVDTHEAGGNAVRVWIHADSAHTPVFGKDGRVTASDAKGSLIPDLRRYLRWAQELNLLVVLCLWNAAVLPNTRGEYGLFGSRDRLQSYFDAVLSPMVAALANESSLAAWEVINEPEGSVSPGVTSASNPCFDTTLLNHSGAGWAQAADRGGGPPIPMSSMLNFIGLHAAAIHAADPRALVTTGQWAERSLSEVVGRHYTSRTCLAAAAGGGEGGELGDRLLDGVRLDFYQTHAYAHPAGAAYASTSPFCMDAASYGLDAPLVVGEFARGEHSGGLSAREQYTTLLRRGYSGAWGWAASSSEHFDGMRAIRDAAAVAAIRLPPLLAEDASLCPPTSPGRRRQRDSFEGVTPDDYLAHVSEARRETRWRAPTAP
jgi:mannan endo-1,4-beta-mannosidase